MADVPADTQAAPLPQGNQLGEGLAYAPLDGATGTVQSQDGPTDRAGTEAEEVARGDPSLGAERDKPAGP